MNQEQKARGKSQLEATIIRADGTVIPLGVVSRSEGWWRFSPQRLLSVYRIRKANRGLAAQGSKA